MSAVVDRVEIAVVDMPFAEGDWHFALGSSTIKRGFFVRLRDDEGRHGWGYFGEIVHDGEIVGGAIALLERMIGAFVGRTATEVADYLATDPGPYGNRRAKASIEMAALDLASRQSGRPPLEDRAGPRTGPDRIDVMRIVPLGQPDEVAAHAVDLVAEGYRYLKFKAEGDLGLDVARIEHARAAVGEGPRFIVDANQSYRPKAAVQFAQRVADLGVDIFEQPVHRDDLDGLRFVRERSGLSVEADESVGTEQQVIALIRANAVDGISVKFPKLGGLLRTVQVARLAAAAGLTVRIGSAFGSRLYGAANMHLIGYIPNHYAAELGEFEHLGGDPVRGMSVVNGQLELPKGAGFGLEVEADQLEWRAIGG